VVKYVINLCFTFSRTRFDHSS